MNTVVVRRSLFPATIMLALAACADNPDDSPAREPANQLWDSASVPIIENPRPPEGSRLDWRVGPGPTVSIGALDGEDAYLFQSAPDALRLSDGRIVVVESGSAELRVFDGTSGIHLATWGGTGEGPGEFRDLRNVHPLAGDSIIGWGFPPVLTVLDSDGDYVRSFQPATRDAGYVGRRMLSPTAALDDGSILASVLQESDDTVVAVVWDSEGRMRGPLGAHLANARRVWTSEFWHREIFGWNLKLATWADLVIVTPSDRYEIRAFEPDGTLARIVRMEHARRSPTAAHVEAFIEARVSEASVSRREQVRRHHGAAPVAEYFPAFSSVLSDRLGHLWVEEFDVPGDGQDAVLWTVFDPEGHVLGLVETPQGLQIYEIGEDYLLGSMEDELGLDYIQLWALNRTGTSG